MTHPATFTARFAFGRLFSDTGRVIARGWPALLLCLVVVGAPTAAGESVVWWTGRDEHVWATVKAAKAAAALVGFSLLGATVTTVALTVLGGAPRQGALLRALVYGAPTALILNIFVNWTSVVSPLVTIWTLPALVAWPLLGLGPLTCVVLAAIFWLLAIPAAVAERRIGFGAMARSARLSKGLRWRLLGLMAGYLVVLFVTQTFVWGGVFGVGHMTVGESEMAMFAITSVALVLGALAQIITVSAFLQARRIADGPTDGEVTDVFG